MQSQLEVMNDQLMVLAALLQSRQETSLSHSTTSLARSSSSAAPSPYTAPRTTPTLATSSSDQSRQPFAFSPSLAKKPVPNEMKGEEGKNEEKEVKEEKQPAEERTDDEHKERKPEEKARRDRELMQSVNVTMRTEKKGDKEQTEGGGLRLRDSNAEEDTDEEDPEKLRLKRLLRFSSSTL